MQSPVVDYSGLVALITSIAAMTNVGAIAWQAWRKTKPEIKKLEAEGDSEIVESAHMNLEASEISTKMLINRIEELKKDVENEKELRRQDRAYFGRRLREMDRELHDYRQWAAQLAKQVIEAGKTPAPFIPSVDTDKNITAQKPEDIK